MSTEINSDLQIEEFEISAKEANVMAINRFQFKSDNMKKMYKNFFDMVKTAINEAEPKFSVKVLILRSSTVKLLNDGTLSPNEILQSQYKTLKDLFGNELQWYDTEDFKHDLDLVLHKKLVEKLNYKIKRQRVYRNVSEPHYFYELDCGFIYTISWE